jgi:hypothetical protein
MRCLDGWMGRGRRGVAVVVGGGYGRLSIGRRARPRDDEDDDCEGWKVHGRECGMARRCSSFREPLGNEVGATTGAGSGRSSDDGGAKPDEQLGTKRYVFHKTADDGGVVPTALEG